MRSLNSVLVTTALLLVLSTALSAQSNKKYKVSLKKIEVHNDLNTPTFNDRIDKKKSVPLKKWVAVIATYDVKFANIKLPKGSLDNGKWLDDVEVKWEFMYKPKDAPKNIANYTRFNRSTKYVNVGEGEHQVVIFVNPVVINRYFKDGTTFKKDAWLRFSMKVNGLKETGMNTIVVDGKPVKKAQELAQYNQAFNSDRSKSLDNILLRRNETPFRSIQFDQFDSIAVEEK